jgi:4-amino-4-deoxy-L-arabinose transferase-like glycosyltransferase
MTFRRFSPEQCAAILFAFVRTALCAYRAARQSLTVDEATTFNDYVRGQWARIYQHYDPNNHVLYSILAKLSVRGFRVSEFTLRLPSVLAGFFLVLGIYWVLETTVPSRAIRWVALVTLSLFPLLFDLSIAARGYGLGLTFLVWALYHSLRGRDLAAGVLLGFGVAANLTIAFPAVGLIAAPLALGGGNIEARARRVLEMAISPAIVCGLIYGPLLGQAHASQFYLGEPTIAAAILNLIFTSVRASVSRPGLFGTLYGTRVIEFSFLPAITAFILAVSVRTFLRTREAHGSLTPVFMLIAAMIELVCAHYLAGMNYPVDRVGIYLVLLFGIAWAIAVSQVPYLAVRMAHGVLASVLVVQFATQFEMGYFELWPADYPAKDVAKKLREECRGKPPNSISLSATWFQVPALEFYRYYYRIAALKPVERHATTALAGFDYYVLNLKDDDDVRHGDRSRLIPLQAEPISGVLLAKEPAQ